MYDTPLVALVNLTILADAIHEQRKSENAQQKQPNWRRM